MCACVAGFCRRQKRKMSETFHGCHSDDAWNMSSYGFTNKQCSSHEFTFFKKLSPD